VAQIRYFETIREDDQEVVVKTGYGAVMRKKFDAPMPEFVSFDTDTIEKFEALDFDDPYDKRRYDAAGDNQIAGVGDGFARVPHSLLVAATDLRRRVQEYAAMG